MQSHDFYYGICKACCNIGLYTLFLFILPSRDRPRSFLLSPSSLSLPYSGFMSHVSITLCGWLVLVNLTQMTFMWEEGISVEEMPASHRPCLRGHFLDCWLMWKCLAHCGGTIPGQAGGPRLCKKGRRMWVWSKPARIFSLCFLLLLLFEYMPWLPSVIVFVIVLLFYCREETPRPRQLL